MNHSAQHLIEPTRKSSSIFQLFVSTLLLQLTSSPAPDQTRMSILSSMNLSTNLSTVQSQNSSANLLLSLLPQSVISYSLNPAENFPIVLSHFTSRFFRLLFLLFIKLPLSILSCLFHLFKDLSVLLLEAFLFLLVVTFTISNYLFQLSLSFLIELCRSQQHSSPSVAPIFPALLSVRQTGFEINSHLTSSMPSHLTRKTSHVFSLPLANAHGHQK